MRILMVGLPDRPVLWGVGSVEHVILNLAHALSLDHEVFVASCGTGAYIADHFHRQNVDPLADSGLYALPTPYGVPYRVAGEPFERVALSSAADAPDVVASIGIDVVSAHDDPSLALDSPAPVLFTAHSLPSRWVEFHPERTAAALSCAAAITAFSPYVADHVAMRSARDDVAVTPLFAPPLLLNTPPQSATPRRVLVASRLTSSAGVIDLCALWRRHAVQGCTLSVVDFPALDASRRDVEEIRSFVRTTPGVTLIKPWISQLQGAAVLRETAVVAACPVDDNPSPFGVLEARAAGCRVVGFEHPVIDEVAGTEALLVPRGDHRALAAALATAIKEDSPVLRTAIQRNAEAAYPLAHTVAFYEGLLHQACR